MEAKKPDAKSNPYLTIVVWVVSGSIILVAFVTLLWKIGLFDRSSSAPSADIIAAVIGLLGVIITAAISLVGYFLKQAFDEHSIRLQQATEDRLKLEAAIKAIGLMSTESGGEVPLTQRSGALFALVTLNQIDLALALLDTLWPKPTSDSGGDSGVDSGTAVWVVDKALQSSERRHQMEAATIMFKNKKELLNDFSIFWPECFYLRWSYEVDPRARNVIFMTLLEVLAETPKEHWKFGSIFQIIGILQNIIKSQKEDKEIRAAAVLVQNCLQKNFADGSESKIPLIDTADGKVSLEDMWKNPAIFKSKEGRDAAKGLNPYYLDMLEKIEKMSSAETEPEGSDATPDGTGKA